MIKPRNSRPLVKKKSDSVVKIVASPNPKPLANTSRNKHDQ